MEQNKRTRLNKLLFHPKFTDTIADINKLNVRLPKNPVNEEIDFQSHSFPPDGELVTNIEEIRAYPLDAHRGMETISNDRAIVAYDESINRYSTLEGESFLTSHSLIVMGLDDYIPVNLITFYFYTRSKNIAEDSISIRYSDSPEVQSKKDYINDKIDFLIKFVPEHSILLIDGPLIGGDYYVLMISAINRFLKKDIIPIFFVKNSTSNLVTDNLKEYKYKFNSDMHWAYKFLKVGERTNLFKYVDRKNKANAKIFCYIKAYDLSPQRIEFHSETYRTYKSLISSILDLIYYLILVQGDTKNPQARPIAIAEKYARETLKLIDINKIIKKSNLVPTMNEGRGFAW